MTQAQQLANLSQMAGFIMPGRNRIINGSCIIAQRANSVMTGNLGWVYGATDRIRTFSNNTGGG